jgi:hypothetical protein
VHASGVEPDVNANKLKGIQSNAHKNAHTDSDLQKVVSAWAFLSRPLKVAVLALVQAATGKGGKDGLD